MLCGTSSRLLWSSSSRSDHPTTSSFAWSAKKKWRRRLSSSLLLSKATTTTARIVEHLIQHSHFIFSVLAIHFSHWSHRISTISYLYLSSIYLFLFLTMLSVLQWLWQCPMLLLSVDDGLKEPKWIGSTGTCTEETPRECRRERERDGTKWSAMKKSKITKYWKKNSHSKSRSA